MNRKKIIWISILLLVLSFILVSILPDLLILFRNLLKWLPFTTWIFQNSITDDTFLSSATSPLFSICAIVVSIFSLSISMSMDKKDSDRELSKIINSTTQIIESIDNNMNSIINIKKDQGDIQDLQVNNELKEYASYLLSVDKLSPDEYKYYIDFLEMVEMVKNSSSSNKDNNLNLFSQAYLEKDKNIFKEELQDFKSKLSKIRRGDKSGK